MTQSTLRPVSRRTLLSVAVSALGSLSAIDGDDIDATWADHTIDPAVANWQAWYAVNIQRAELCKAQQKCERQLLRLVGSFPHVKVAVPGEKRPIPAANAAQIERLLPGEDMHQARENANVELAAKQRRWAEADEQVGYSRAYEAETKVAAKETSLAGRLSCTPAQSIPGVIAHLHMILETHDPNSQLDGSPWIELRRVLADLLRINAA